MVKEIIETGKTVDEAVEAGLQKLGATADQVNIEIIDMPKKGFLGLTKNTLAKVKLTLELTKVETAKMYLQDILDKMNISKCNVELKESTEETVFEISGENTGFIIGRRGETLDALQYLTSLVANKGEGDYRRISLDCNGYREKREKALEGLARKIAYTVVKTGKPSTLEPMNPYERRIIHAAVQTVKGATSSSTGEEPYRRVMISSTLPRKPYNRDRKDFNKPGNRPYNNNNKNRYNNSDRKGYQDKKAEPFKRPTPPSEAAGKPLYSKIDINSDN